MGMSIRKSARNGAPKADTIAEGVVPWLPAMRERLHVKVEVSTTDGVEVYIVTLDDMPPETETRSSSTFTAMLYRLPRRIGDGGGDHDGGVRPRRGDLGRRPDAARRLFPGRARRRHEDLQIGVEVDEPRGYRHRRDVGGRRPHSRDGRESQAGRAAAARRDRARNTDGRRHRDGRSILCRRVRRQRPGLAERVLRRRGRLLRPWPRHEGSPAVSRRRRHDGCPANHPDHRHARPSPQPYRGGPPQVAPRRGRGRPRPL